jgi:glycosyltransferase involved in cell wall biosynthesis
VLGKRIAFISTMVTDQWGGSEELWSRAALKLAAEGFAVSASVQEWSPPHRRVSQLTDSGVEVWQRPSRYSTPAKLWHRAARSGVFPIVMEFEKLFAKAQPDLVVFSDGGPFPFAEALELCVTRQLPFVTIGQSNSDKMWIDDQRAGRFRRALSVARRCYFVSQANLRLAERQLGSKLHNAEVVWNPFNVSFDAEPAWPALREGEELRLACVGRLHPPSKGQDILLEALSRPNWRDRRWRLTLYGEGPMRDIIARLAEQAGLSDRVFFAGHVAPEIIWTTDHVLAMPSRYEGLPLAMVEAMLCGRPVVATDVAGHAEILENEVTGFLAEAPTAAMMARALETLWSKRAHLEAMGQAGAKRIRNLLTTADPSHAFAEKIKSIAANAVPASFAAPSDWVEDSRYLKVGP